MNRGQSYANVTKEEREGLLHLPPAFHPLILADVPGKHLPPPFLQHVGEGKCGHNGERLLQEEVNLRFCEGRNTC